MKKVESEHPDERITYVSLFLSIIALSLFIISGFQATKELTKDQDQVSSSFIWNFDPDTQVASLKRGVQMACIGMDFQTCRSLTTERSGGMVVQGGIQIGQNIFQTRDAGKILEITNELGDPVASVNLISGAINFGSHSPVRDGFVMSGQAANSSYDTSVWSATSVINFVGPNDPNTVIGTISEVYHNAGLHGIRVCPAYGGNPFPVKATSCMHITDLGPIIVGDASWSYIQAYAKNADVIVAGSTVSLESPEPLQCAQLAVSEADIFKNMDQAFQILRLVFSGPTCTADSLKNMSLITQENGNLKSCQYGTAYFLHGPARNLGVCREESGESIIEYCNPSIVPSK